MRALARRLSRQLPQTSYNEIRFVVGDDSLARDAPHFFTKTREAIQYAAEHAPYSYSEFRKDVATIVLRPGAIASPYNRFQFAVLVPASIVGTDASAYAAWLLYASGLSFGTGEADKRTSELLQTLDPEMQERIRALLPRATD